MYSVKILSIKIALMYHRSCIIHGAILCQKHSEFPARALFGSHSTVEPDQALEVLNLSFMSHIAGITVRLITLVYKSLPRSDEITASCFLFWGAVCKCSIQRV